VAVAVQVAGGAAQLVHSALRPSRELHFKVLAVSLCIPPEESRRLAHVSAGVSSCHRKGSNRPLFSQSRTWHMQWQRQRSGTCTGDSSTLPAITLAATQQRQRQRERERERRTVDWDPFCFGAFGGEVCVPIRVTTERERGRETCFRDWSRVFFRCASHSGTPPLSKAAITPSSSGIRREISFRRKSARRSDHIAIERRKARRTPFSLEVMPDGDSSGW
jgi:hypothetical protein